MEILNAKHVIQVKDLLFLELFAVQSVLSSSLAELITVMLVPMLLRDAKLVCTMMETLNVQHVILLEDLFCMEQFAVSLMEVESVHSVQKDVYPAQKALVQSVTQAVGIICRDLCAVTVTWEISLHLLDVRPVQAWSGTARLAQCIKTVELLSVWPVLLPSSSRGPLCAVMSPATNTPIVAETVLPVLISF